MAVLKNKELGKDKVRYTRLAEVAITLLVLHSQNNPTLYGS